MMQLCSQFCAGGAGLDDGEMKLAQKQVLAGSARARRRLPAGG